MPDDEPTPETENDATATHGGGAGAPGGGLPGTTADGDSPSGGPADAPAPVEDDPESPVEDEDEAAPDPVADPPAAADADPAPAGAEPAPEAAEPAPRRRRRAAARPAAPPAALADPVPTVPARGEASDAERDDEQRAEERADLSAAEAPGADVPGPTPAVGETTAEAPAAGRRPRRAASRPAGAAAVTTDEAAGRGEPATTDEAAGRGEPATTDEAAGRGEPATTDEAAGREEAGRRRRRAARRPAAPPVVAEADGEPAPAAPEPGGTGSAGDDRAAEDAAPDESGSGTAPAPRTRRRRSRRGSGSDDAAQPAGDDTEDAPDHAARVLEAVDGDADIQPVEESAGATSSATEGGGRPTLAAPDAADAATSAGRARPPVTVTFQPPTPVPAGDADAAPARPRRRRASRAAAPAADLDAGPEEQAVEADAESDRDDERPGDDDGDGGRSRRRRRGRRGRGRVRGDDGDAGETGDVDDDEDESPADTDADTAESRRDEDVDDDESGDEGEASGTRRRRRRRRRSGGEGSEGAGEPEPAAKERPEREPRESRRSRATGEDDDGVRGITGSTRMEAKRQRRREGRDSGRRRPPIVSEAEFLARRESVERVMLVRDHHDRTQVAVLEDGVLVEHYVTQGASTSYAGNIYLGKVQNVLPSMEAAFIDIGKGRNGVLYAGEVNWDSVGDGQPRRIESALKSGQDVLVQVSKDPIGHKGARLTSQISLPGRYLVYVPGSSMTGISRKLPDTERARLKAILKKVVPDDGGVIVRTAAEGASESELTRDVERLVTQWQDIQAKAAKGKGPTLLYGEPDLVVRVVRDVFNEDFTSLVVQGDREWETVRQYVEWVAPDLLPRVSKYTGTGDLFADHRVDEQLAKALDRKVWLPSGGSLVIDRTEAMVVIDVNTGKFVGKGSNLEETVTKNNLEAAEEIVRQCRLRDLGGIIVIDFIDMVLESNRDLVLRRLTECLGRDRTKHQVAEVTSLGLVQMTRKRVGQGLLEAFSEPCPHCNGRGLIVSTSPVPTSASGGNGSGRGAGGRGRGPVPAPPRGIPVAPRSASEPDVPADTAGLDPVEASAEGEEAVAERVPATADGPGSTGLPLPEEVSPGPEEAPAAPTDADVALPDEPAPAAPAEPAVEAPAVVEAPEVVEPATLTPAAEQPPAEAKPKRRRRATRAKAEPAATGGAAEPAATVGSGSEGEGA